MFALIGVEVRTSFQIFKHAISFYWTILLCWNLMMGVSINLKPGNVIILINYEKTCEKSMHNWSFQWIFVASTLFFNLFKPKSNLINCLQKYDTEYEAIQWCFNANFFLIYSNKHSSQSKLISERTIYHTNHADFSVCTRLQSSLNLKINTQTI